MFRLVVQESRLTPTSGKVVAQLGSFDPHSKTVRVDSEKASFYLKNGAQPSDRAARLLEKEGVKLPGWVVKPAGKQRSTRNPDKLRKNRSAEEVEAAAEPETTPAEAETEAAPAEAADAPEAEAGTTTAYA